MKTLLLAIICCLSLDGLAQWKIETYLDSFGDPTDSKFATISAVGKFSNSATTNSPLFIKIAVDDEAIGVMLHEYDKARPPVRPTQGVTINLKNQKGEIAQFRSMSEWNRQGGIAVRNASNYGREYTELRDFLEKSVGEVKVYIYDEGSSTYNFTINCNGLQRALSGF